MQETIHKDIGKHEAQIEGLEDRMERVEHKLDKVLSTLSEATGGWKTLMLVAGVAGSVGALAVKFLPFLHK